MAHNMETQATRVEWQMTEFRHKLLCKWQALIYYSMLWPKHLFHQHIHLKSKRQRNGNETTSRKRCNTIRMCTIKWSHNNIATCRNSNNNQANQQQYHMMMRIIRIINEDADDTKRVSTDFPKQSRKCKSVRHEIEISVLLLHLLKRRDATNAYYLQVH